MLVFSSRAVPFSVRESKNLCYWQIIVQPMEKIFFSDPAEPNMIIVYDNMRLMFEQMNVVEKELLEYGTVTQFDWVCLG